ncbi:hypothetical protein BpHYR1_037385 [Brachionus plicatilis]|uniref:Uncharacterized protein n=1 Tax=Brachionus plicatilis TaxID=10195 RepID=A0A3M7QJJ7_BRAPC|nr:hypothetical protein BpHYR1_037385 [Brachionus plicatilis]
MSFKSSNYSKDMSEKQEPSSKKKNVVTYRKLKFRTYKIFRKIVKKNKNRIVVKKGDLFVLFGHGYPICTILWRSHTKFRSLGSRNSATRQCRLFSSPILARNT